MPQLARTESERSKKLSYLCAVNYKILQNVNAKPPIGFSTRDFATTFSLRHGQFSAIRINISLNAKLANVVQYNHSNSFDYFEGNNFKKSRSA